MIRLPTPLRLPAIWFVTSLVLGSSVFYLALNARMACKTGQLAAQSAAGLAARDLHRTPQRLAQDRAQADTYARLRNAGFIGTEDRLDWLGSLARLRDELGLQQVGWRLAPRTPSNLSPGLYSSTMVVEIAPADAHQLDLFLNRLHALAHGRFTVRECTLQPEAGGRTANCTLDWWTWNGQ
jgi:hypothetical protein